MEQNNIIEPIQESNTPKQHTEGTGYVSDIPLKSLEFAEYLGVKNEVHSSDVQEKVNFISENTENVFDLMQLDSKLGEGPKLDKIYTYLKLLDNEKQLANRMSIINQKRHALQSNSGF